MKRRWLVPVGGLHEAVEARVALDALAEHDPGAAAYLLWPGITPLPEALTGDAFEVIEPADFGVDADAVGHLRASYDDTELDALLLPLALAHLAQDGVAVAVLRPQVALLADPAPVWEPTDRAVVVFRTASTLTPRPRDRADAPSGYPAPAQRVSLVAGEGGQLISAQLFVVHGSAHARERLAAWPLPLTGEPSFEESSGRFAVALWLTDAVLRGDALVRDDARFLLGANAIADADLRLENGVLTAPNGPVVAVGFADFDPDHPHVIRPGRLDLRLSERPALAAAALQRAARLNAVPPVELPAPDPAVPGELSGLARLANGLVVEQWVRQLYRRARRSGALSRSPFTPEGLAEFEAYVRQPARRGGKIGVNRLLLGFYESRPDLMAAYPVLDGPDAVGLIGWAHVYGIPHAALPEKLLPRRPEGAEDRTGHRDEPDTPGVNLAGFFTSELGLGEGARQLATALQSAGEPLTTVQGLVLPATRQQAGFTPASPRDAEHDVNLLVVNGDIVPSFAADVGPEFFAGRRTAALWWWECEPFPTEDWSKAFEWVDEVYVGTEFVQNLIAPHVNVPVRRFPMPVSLTPSDPLPRSDFGIAEDRPMFFYMWDYHSSVERKNPVGLVRAFREAFPEPGDATLVLKCINHENLPEAHERVLIEIGDRDDIVLVDRFLPAGAKNRLLELCDCYVSPHRSEGFGHTPAEAMLLGKPVIATGYSGNLDYMSADRGILLDYELRQIGPIGAPYPAHGVWAEPDHDQLVKALRWVAANPEEAAAMGRRGQDHIVEHHSPEASGRALRALLEETRAAGRTAREVAADAAAQAQPTPQAAAKGRPPGAGNGPARAALEQVASLPGIGTARRKWWNLMDRAVASRTVPRLTELSAKIDSTSAEEASKARRAAVGEAVDALSPQLEGAERRAEAARQHAAALDAQLQETRHLLDQANQEAGVLRDHVQDTQRHLATIEDRLGDHLNRHSAVPWTRPSAGFGQGEAPGLGRTLTTAPREATGDRYADFLSDFRGDFDRVKNLLELYGPLLKDHGPLLDLGCGRGELVEIAREHGTPAKGIDEDAELIAQGVARGLDLEAGDANAVLQAQAPGSLGSVSAIHVIEHLTAEQLTELVRLAFDRLRPGGLLILETINPHEVSAASTFWVDLTHQGPVFPEVSLSIARAAGFATNHVFAPGASGDWAVDRTQSTRYALVATK